MKCVKWISRDKMMNRTEGYCVAVDARNVDLVRTLCGMFVHFSGGAVDAEPTCAACLKKIEVTAEGEVERLRGAMGRLYVALDRIESAYTNSEAITKKLEKEVLAALDAAQPTEETK